MDKVRTDNREAMAREVLSGVGGPGNVDAVTSCFTRLRFVLKDDSKASQQDLEKIDGVLSVVRAGGQLQVVVGSDVPAVREEVERLLPQETSEGTAPQESKGNLFNRFVALVSALFQPFLWVLAGTGLLKALLVLLSTVGMLDQTSSTAVILNAGADSLFHFLPMFLAFTAAKRFHANPYLSLALAGGLLYPAITTLGQDGAAVTFLGIPVVMTSYVSSVIPIIIIVWVQSYLEKWLKRVLPGSISNFLTPALIVLFLFPISLMTIGPATTYLSQGVADGVQWLYALSPAAAGFIIGGTAQALVVFGLHWAVIAVIINEYATLGHSFMILPFYAAVAAQTGAAMAVFLRTRDPRMKQVAGPASLSGLLAGITEPILYGVNIPLRRPFVIGLISGAVGGAVIGISGTVSKAFAIPSLITTPVALGTGNFPLFMVGVVGALVLAFVLTLFFGVKGSAADATAADSGAADSAVDTTADTSSADVPSVADESSPARAARTTEVLAPMSGTTLPLDAVPDKAFASGSMGVGLGLEPTEGTVFAPVTGRVLAALPHAYGIRTDDGTEVLVHVGLDTVKLKGLYFAPAVETGDLVTAGDPLVTVDLEAVRAAGYDTTTVVLVMNAATLGRVEPAAAGEVTAGDSVISIGAATPADAS
ncbi:PTS system beta-glucoside-specific EIIBCA component [bioreactor metagenome]|uniref:PTS system beta-glucoside-specific EIIBCA component n=2 Tax=root TaxID=1 RepID=A0A644YBP2_9ZZZZ